MSKNKKHLVINLTNDCKTSTQNNHKTFPRKKIKLSKILIHGDKQCFGLEHSRLLKR